MIALPGAEQFRLDAKRLIFADLYCCNSINVALLCRTSEHIIMLYKAPTKNNNYCCVAISFSKKYEGHGSNTYTILEEQESRSGTSTYTRAAIDNVAVSFLWRLLVANSRLICDVTCSNLL